MATEKRLIRYDGLKQEIIDFKKGLNPKNTDYATGYFSALSVVEGMMVQHVAEDAVEIVRCKDCKHWQPIHEHIPHMECQIFCGAYEHGYPTNADDFCSYGTTNK